MSLRQQGPSSAAVQRRLPDAAVTGFGWSCSPGVQRTVPDSQSGQADHLGCKGRLSPSMGADACYLSAFVSKWIAAACLECEPIKPNFFLFLCSLSDNIYGNSIPDFAFNDLLCKSPVLCIGLPGNLFAESWFGMQELWFIIWWKKWKQSLESKEFKHFNLWWFSGREIVQVWHICWKEGLHDSVV